MGLPIPVPPALLADTPTPDFMANTITGLVDSLALVVGVVGIGVLLCGTYAIAVRLIGSQLAAARGPGPTVEPETPRLQFVPYLLLGLEFIIAAGAIKTLVHPDWQSVAVLGGMVLIRAVAGFSLHWETARAPNLAEAEMANGRSLPAPEGTNGWPVPGERRMEVPVQAGR
jgi:uncharacterized membrane protein